MFCPHDFNWNEVQMFYMRRECFHKIDVRLFGSVDTIKRIVMRCNTLEEIGTQFMLPASVLPINAWSRDRWTSTGCLLRQNVDCNDIFTILLSIFLSVARNLDGCPGT